MEALIKKLADKNDTKKVEKKSKNKQEPEQKDIVSKVVEKSSDMSSLDPKVKPVNFKALNMSDSQHILDAAI